MGRGWRGDQDCPQRGELEHGEGAGADRRIGFLEKKRRELTSHNKILMSEMGKKEKLYALREVIDRANSVGEKKKKRKKRTGGRTVREKRGGRHRGAVMKVS